MRDLEKKEKILSLVKLVKKNVNRTIERKIDDEEREEHVLKNKIKKTLND